MNRISVPFFYDLGAKLSQLDALQHGVTLGTAYPALWGAKTELENLFATPWFAPAIKSAWAPGQKLLLALNAITIRTDFTAELNFFEIVSFSVPLTEFVTVVRAELGVADVYFVTRKGAYDVTCLITNAESLCAAELGMKVPAAIPELREAGKCLAFELSTASGFHIFRATELVVHAYWDAVANNTAPPKMKTLGAYLKKMTDKKIGNEKVVANMMQIKDLHRNPLIHPQETLTLEDAIGLMGICVSAINAMLKAIPAPAPSTPTAYFPSQGQ